jgi:hypothetical protein
LFHPFSFTQVSFERKGRLVPPNPMSKGAETLIVNSQQVLPLAKVAVEAHALGDPKRRDDASLDLLAALSGSFEVRRSSLRD